MLSFCLKGISRDRFSSLLCLLFVFFIQISSSSFAQETQNSYQARLIKKFYSIGTASINGTYYPLGNAISRLFCRKLKKMVTIAEPTAGSIANVEYLRKGHIDLALMQSDVAWMAYNGSSIFSNNAFSNLRVLSALYSEKIQIVVKADSPIKVLADIKGKKIALGEETSGSAAGAIQILEAAGLKQGDYEAVFEKFTTSTESLADGYIDALYYVGGVPADGLVRLASKTPIRLIEIPTEVITNVTKAFPYYSTEEIPVGAYKGQNNKVNTLGFKALLTCTDQLPEDEVITMLSVIFANHKIYSEQNEVLVDLKVEDSLKAIDVEMLHDGAKRFFSLR